MGEMKRLHGAIQEAKRLTESQCFDEETLTSMFQTVGEIAKHGNEGTLQLIETLFHMRRQ